MREETSGKLFFLVSIDSHIFLSTQWKAGELNFNTFEASLSGLHTPLMEMIIVTVGQLEKLWGGGGGEFSSGRNLFLLSNSLYEFFFRPLHEYFLGLIGVHEFFFV